MVDFLENPLLYGSDETPGIVAVEHRGDGMELFIRDGDTVTRVKDAFRPFALLREPSLLDGWSGGVSFEELAGGASYRAIAFFDSWKGAQDAVKLMQKRSAGFMDAPFFFITDPVQQYLTITGRTLFKSLPFEALRRLQLDIETYTTEGFEFPNPSRKGDRITLVSLSDSTGWERVINGAEMPEDEMLRRLVALVRERDPDVVEGHNIHKFDLWYIAERARLHKVPLALGRDGGALKTRPSRFNVAERQVTYPRYEIYGRHVVDTWILAQLYDVSARELESYGLKHVARHFGVAAPERTYIQPDRISWHFDHDVETLVKYGLDDVRETRSVSEILSYPFFLQAQMFPYSFQSVAVRGNATRIDALFLREYIRSRTSVPSPPPPSSYEGGYTDLFMSGVVERILHCDVQSLYPSLMLVYGCYPASDTLGVFPRLLGDLRTLRLAAKASMKAAGSHEERRYYDALQGTFKILINSFYGYLGFSMGHFSDFTQAAQVTRLGRETIMTMMEWLRARGCRLVELDTDGIYFQPPGEIDTAAKEEDLVAGLSAALPEGLTIELDGRYRAMLSYKRKNYVLLDYEGNIAITGSGLRSRGIELFQRDFMREMFRLLLEGRKDEIPPLFARTLDDIRNHRLPLEKLVKTETLQESPHGYLEKVRAKKRNPSAAYELALQSATPLQAGDQVSYYVTGSGKRVRVFDHCRLASQWDPGSPDENAEYYAAKLEELYGKFLPFIDGQEMLPFDDGEE